MATDRVLVVAATEREVARLADAARGASHLDLLVTGVGLTATAAHTARALTRGSYAVAFNFGVCGSFDPALAPGCVVHVTSDRIADLGVEDGDRFLSLPDIGLGDDSHVVNDAPPAHPALRALPAVRGISVNTAHGNQASIEAVMARCRPQVESMEGAAFAYACRLCGVPYAQVRAVSNIVELRNRDAWRLEEAIAALNDTALRLLDLA